jgi:hypothetical protein
MKSDTPAHMCRDGHTQIWHNDSEHELCPLCRAERQRDEAVALLREARPFVADGPIDAESSVFIERMDAFLATLDRTEKT